MPQPDKYIKGEDFTEYATEHPAAPYHPAKLDSELNKIASSINALVANIAKLQRDDGALGYGIVNTESLGVSVLALLGKSGFTPRGTWEVNKLYKSKDIIDVPSLGLLVYAVSDHTSSDADADLASGKLMRVSRFISDVSADYTASDIAVNPIAGLAASDVQDALALIVKSVDVVASRLADIMPLIDALTARIDSAESAIANLIANGSGGSSSSGTNTRFSFLKPVETMVLATFNTWTRVPISSSGLINSLLSADTPLGKMRYPYGLTTGLGDWIEVSISAKYIANGSTQFTNGGFSLKLTFNEVDTFLTTKETGSYDSRVYRTKFSKSERIVNVGNPEYITFEAVYLLRMRKDDNFSIWVRNDANTNNHTFKIDVVVKQLTAA